MSLFAAGASRFWTVPAGAPFLTALAAALAMAVDLQNRPDALADGIIYLPNRRSARAFSAALHQAAGAERTLLMPEIRALGDLETDDAPPGLDAAFADLGPALSEPRRLGTLMQLVHARFQAEERDLPASSALAAAQELAGLLDEAAIVGKTDWSDLPGLVEAGDLAGHWRASVKFLEIVTTAWPEWLQQEGVEDRLARRLAAARAVAEHWQASPPAGPVIIAGSTGATPASRILMAAARAMPRGVVVLPGLDTALQPDAIAQILDTPNHPQHALMHTLASFGLSPKAIPTLPSLTEDGLDARRALINESLLPADLTGDWRSRLETLSAPLDPAKFTENGLTGLDLMAARDETEEAMLAACLLRETLETPGRTAALVCPDAGLARRVSAHLNRWDLDVPPSEGIPLLHRPAGAWMDALLDWWGAPADPMRIAALLHAPGTTAPEGVADFERWVLRGVCWWETLEALQASLHPRLTDPQQRKRPGLEVLDQIEAVSAWLNDAAVQLGTADKAYSASEFRDALRRALPLLCDPQNLWRGPDGAALAQQVEAILDMAEAYGPLTPEDLLGLWRQLASQANVPPSGPGHPRLQIWGPLEARLQSADHIILAGLNEEVWPRSAGAEAFLPRHFKIRLGLEDPESLMGLAAHDFAGLACAPRVTLLYSERREDAPAVASRWVWRMRTLARGALGGAIENVLSPAPERDPRHWLAALETSEPTQPAHHAEPRPCPPVDARPKRLSVSRIDTLQRDPYAIYAESVLRLSRLDPIDRELDPRDRGTAMHRALELFDETPEIGAEGLADSLEQELRKAGARPEALISERAILANIAAWYVDWHAGRQPGLMRVKNEVSGEYQLSLDGAPAFTLSAQADRIEIREGGALAILDFKTGKPPSDKVIGVGLSQQMPLQVLIARAGGFADVPASAVTELTYVSVRARPEVRMVGTGRDLKKSPMELADEAQAGLERLITGYMRATQAYLSAPRAQFVQYEGDYGRLARRAEWTSEISDG
ncbi:MAG: double-strand break repair protein AddB [Hyphomonadaceae bacterium]|nr:double-strand break repair protein AddB [Hyphomonadaceae bacterium]